MVGKLQKVAATKMIIVMDQKKQMHAMNPNKNLSE